MMPALPVPEAAVELEVSEVTLRRWIASGAPVARRGRRGRGGRTLVDVQAVRAWRASQRVTLAAAAAGLPDVLADALADALEQADGLPKQRTAGLLALAWYLAATRCMDHLREFDSAVPDVADPLPLAVEQLRKIAAR